MKVSTEDHIARRPVGDIIDLEPIVTAGETFDCYMITPDEYVWRPRSLIPPEGEEPTMTVEAGRRLYANVHYIRFNGVILERSYDSLVDALRYVVYIIQFGSDVALPRGATTGTTTFKTIPAKYLKHV